MCSAGVAHPIEMIKCKLQQQRALSATSPSVSVRPGGQPIPVTFPYRAYSTSAAAPAEFFRNPFDVVKQTVQVQGPLGMWRGFGATLIFRSSFAVSLSGVEIW